jgi:hypothetical protein
MSLNTEETPKSISLIYRGPCRYQTTLSFYICTLFATRCSMTLLVTLTSRSTFSAKCIVICMQSASNDKLASFPDHTVTFYVYPSSMVVSQATPPILFPSDWVCGLRDYIYGKGSSDALMKFYLHLVSFPGPILMFCMLKSLHTLKRLGEARIYHTVPTILLHRLIVRTGTCIQTIMTLYYACTVYCDNR